MPGNQCSIEHQVTLGNLKVVEDIKCTLNFQKVDEERIERKVKDVEWMLKEITENAMNMFFQTTDGITDGVKKSIQSKLKSHFIELLREGQ